MFTIVSRCLVPRIKSSIGGKEYSHQLQVNVVAHADKYIKTQLELDEMPKNFLIENPSSEVRYILNKDPLRKFAIH